MTLATKNGSIIAKDGALAENCGCCGGWYCCNFEFMYDTTTLCPLSTLIGGVTVQVTTGDDFTRIYYPPSSTCLNGVTGAATQIHAKGIAITPSRHYAGEFALSRSSDTRWSYEYAPDAAGCSARLHVDFYANNGPERAYRWMLTLEHRVHWWRKIASTAITEGKTLQDMKCTQLTISTGTPGNCYQTPDETYGSDAASAYAYGYEVFTCSLAPFTRTVASSLSSRVFGSAGTPVDIGSLDLSFLVSMTTVQ